MPTPQRIRVGILTGCSCTSPKLYARTLLENLPVDEFEVTLIALDKPTFGVPPHVHLIELNSRPEYVLQNDEKPHLQSCQFSPSPSFRLRNTMRKVWQAIAPRTLRAIVGHIKEGRLLAQRLRGLPIDLLHANQFGGNADAFAARLAGFRVVTTLHISTAADRFERTPAMVSHFINFLTVVSSRRLIAVSHAIACDWARYALGSKRRFNVVHHGLPGRNCDVRNVRTSGPVVRFGTAAMLHPKKGQRYLVEAFSRLAEKYPDIELHIAGEGIEAKPLHEMARTLAHSPRIKFRGFIEDMDAFYREIDVFVLPSLTEPFGYVLIEAMASALPVIASNVEAIPEIVLNEQTGILVPAADPVALGMAMERLILFGELRLQMGRSGRQRILEQFTVESMIARTAEAYRGALK